MALKFFKKGEAPETPKQPGGISVFGKKVQLTPTVLDASIRGDQKRTELLETQLKDISKTASMAYDELEETKAEREMLREQVSNQKIIIDSMMNQLDESKQEKLQLKMNQEDQMKATLKEKAEDQRKLTEMTNLQHQLIIDMKRIKSELNGYKSLYEAEVNKNQNAKECEKDDQELAKDGNQPSKSPTQKLQESDQPNEFTSNHLSNVDINAFDTDEERSIIWNNAIKKMNFLEMQIDHINNEYNDSLSSMRNTIVLLKDSQKYLDDGKSFRIKEAIHGDEGSFDAQQAQSSNKRTPYLSKNDENRRSGDENGDTFILSNLSFFK